MSHVTRAPQVNPSAMAFQISVVQDGQPQCVVVVVVGEGVGTGVGGVGLMEHRAGSHAGPQTVGNSSPATRAHAACSLGYASGLDPRTHKIRAPQVKPAASAFQMASVQVSQPQCTEAAEGNGVTGAGVETGIVAAAGAGCGVLPFFFPLDPPPRMRLLSLASPLEKESSKANENKRAFILIDALKK